MLLRITKNFLTNRAFLPLRVALLAWGILTIIVFAYTGKANTSDIEILPETGIVNVCNDINKKNVTELTELEQGYVEFCSENLNLEEPLVGSSFQKQIVVVTGVTLIILILYFLIKYEFAKEVYNVIDKAFMKVNTQEESNIFSNSGYLSWTFVLFFLVIGFLFIIDTYV